MKKRISALVLAALMAFTVGCRSEQPAAPAAANPAAPSAPDAPEGSDSAEAGNYKIGIITGTVSQGEEEFRQAETMKAKYGDRIVTSTYPDNFSSETETVISNVLGLASDPEVKVIVFCQAVPGAAAAIDKTRETRPDMLFICGVPGEDPAIIASKADIVLQSDELAMGTTIVDEAVKMGAKSLVHYSFPRHMSYALLAARRDLLRENCEKAGINFVEATAPDPTGDAGVAGAQQFILEDVPRKVAELGPDTAFFSTNCSMQEPLIKQVLSEKAMLVQQCCPSPYHAYPAALGIEIPEDKKGDVPFILEQITAKVEEGGNTGRMGTWPVPINMLFVEAGVEYGVKYCEGETNGRVDDAVMRQIIEEVASSAIEGAGEVESAQITAYDEDGVSLDNFYMILCKYIIF